MITYGNWHPAKFNFTLLLGSLTSPGPGHPHISPSGPQAPAHNLTLPLLVATVRLSSPLLWNSRSKQRGRDQQAQHLGTC